MLRLMAGVIHCLWERGDKSLMILPSSVPLDDPIVQAKITRLLEEKWDAIIAADIDGEISRPLAIDRENPNLACYSATRRVARTIFMAAAPTYGSPNPGIDDRRVRLGCAQPGETPGSFGDALRRLADRATYLYVDQNRYWFSTQPSVTRTADDRAKHLKADEVWEKLVERLRQDRERGPFAGVHVAPDDSGDVPDELEARLVVLGPAYPYDGLAPSKAQAAAEEILTHRGQQPRIFRNAVLFLAPDGRRLGELEQAMRAFLPWRSIVDASETLQLTPFQARQAKTKRDEWDRTVTARVLETWVSAMAPGQPDPRNPTIEWTVNRVSGQEPLAVRAGKRFTSDEALLVQFGALRLRRALDQHELWRGRNHVEVKQVISDFGTYLYLPRLRDRQLVQDAIRSAVGQLVCDQLAYADGFDDASGRYIGVVARGGGHTVIDPAGLIVKPEVALRQLELERGAVEGPEADGDGEVQAPPGTETQTPRLAHRFFGSVALDPLRPGRDVGRIAEEVLQHLATVPGANVRITVEIEADVPDGVPDRVRQIVDENCRTLRFREHGFD